MRTLQPCGTRAAYIRHLRHREVPCDACRSVNTAYQNARTVYRATDPAAADQAGHGKASTYSNYTCRCEPCRKAKSEKNRRDRVRRTTK